MDFPADRNSKVKSADALSALAIGIIHRDLLSRACWTSQRKNEGCAHTIFESKTSTSQEEGECAIQNGNLLAICAPNEIRTRVPGLKSPCPGPLDDGGEKMTKGKFQNAKWRNLESITLAYHLCWFSKH